MGKRYKELLVIEDNSDVAYYIHSCLHEIYKITFAKNGQEGIDKAIESIPDIIISDVMMPEKDGYEVVQVLKKDERTSHIPIVLLTAKADIVSKLEGLERGADAYLAKPFNKQELKIRLSKLIELRQKLQQRFSVLNNQQPTTSNQEPTTNLEDAFFQKIKIIVERHLDDPYFKPADLGRSLNMSQSQLYRKVKALTNSTPAILIRRIRLQKGRELLHTTELNVSEIAYQVGFTDPAYFSRTYSEEFGITPSSDRKNDATLS